MHMMEHTTNHPDPLMGAQRRVILCAGTGCVANGAMKVYAAFQERMQACNLPFTLELREENDNSGKTAVTRSGCQGFCQMGPLVTILPENILYNQVKPADVEEIIAVSLLGNGVVERLLYVEPGTEHACKGTDDIPFYTRQQRFVLGDCGIIDPENLDEYLRNGGYRAAKKAFVQMSQEEICKEISESGLRGRGGGGFPTGRKWEAARRQPEDKKYVICNADEGDPGAFMNRSVMEGNPHSVIEGMMIAARAIGADEALVYVRAEYPLAVQRMRKAVEDAGERGILGENVFGSGLNISCEVMEGAGAFVCGEETAMIASIEGQRGMPRPKPPFPAAERPVGQADHHQQRRDPGPCRPHHPRRRGSFPRAGHAGFAGHQDLRPHRPRGQHRPDRSALRHHAARDRLRHRRRRHRRRRQH